MTDVQVEVLLERLAKGEYDALTPLMVFCFPAIRRKIRDRVIPDLVKDCVQDTSLRVLEAVKAGRFRNEGVPQFVEFVKTIAWREAGKPPYSAATREESLVVEMDGKDLERDLPAAGSAEQDVVTPLLLHDILDKSLVGSARDQAGKDLGMLKKMAFQAFYVDRLPQREIVNHLNRYALSAHLNVSITDDVVNNWLSGGRILKAVVRYLVRHRGGGLAQLIDLVLPTAKMTKGERDVLLLRWSGRKDVAAIAAECNYSRGEVQTMLETAFNELVVAIKGQLHDGRRLGS